MPGDETDEVSSLRMASWRLLGGIHRWLSTDRLMADLLDPVGGPLDHFCVVVNRDNAKVRRAT